MSYQFNSRDTYLAAQQQWSRDYADAITVVRKAKLAVKAAHRENAIKRAIGLIWDAYAALRRAHEAVEELHAAKVDMKLEAQRQWLAAHRT